MTEISPFRACAAGDPPVPAPAGAERPRRVLFLDHTAVLGGAELAMLRLIRALDRSRFEPVVLLFSDGPLVQALRDIDVEVEVLAADAGLVKADRNMLGVGMNIRTVIHAFSFVRRLSRRARELCVDLLHTNSLKADVLGSFANLLVRKPLVWYVHDRIAEDYMPRRVVRAMRLLARHMPHFLLANSQSSLDNVAWRRADHCAVAYPGVDAAAFAIRDGVAGVRSGAPVVGLVGRVSQTKGQDIFLKAAVQVLKQMPHVRFKVIGAALFNEAAYENILRELAAQLQLGDAVEFSGFCHDVPAAIAGLDLLVHASTVPEPFGQVVVEGMAAGKPVVATRAGGVPEVVIDGQTGLLVPPGDVEAMTRAIVRILSDVPAARAMGIAGRRRAQELFTIERTAAIVQSAYDSVLRTRA